VKTIILTLSGAKDLDAPPREVRKQVEAGLSRYAMTGHGDVKALQEPRRLPHPHWRLPGDPRRGCNNDTGGLHRSPGHDDLQEELRQ
jgi:hypothetical protein